MKAAYVLLLLFALVLSVPASAQAPDVGRNKALVRRYEGQVVNARRLDVLDKIASPNAKRYVSPIAPPLDLAGWKQRLAAFFVAYPDLVCTIEDIIAEGDRVAWRNTCRGTQLGRHPAMPTIPPTGKQIVTGEYFFARIENGKIVEQWGGPDTWLSLQQLGATVTVPTAP